MKKPLLPSAKRVRQQSRSVSCLVGLLLSAVGGPGHAMDLIDAYRAALLNDATYLAARASTESDSEVLPQAQAQLRPSVSYSYARNQVGSTSSSYVSPFNASPKLVYFSDNRSLSFRSPVYHKSLIAGYAQAQSNVQASLFNLKREEQDLSVRVVSAYFDVLLSQEQLQLIQAQKKSAATQLEAAKASFSRGFSPRTDVDEIQARLDGILADEYAAEQQADYARQALRSITNAVPEQLKGLKVSNFYADRSEFANLADWTARALQDSPVVIGMLHKRDAAEQEIEKATSGHVPTVDVVAQLSQSKGENAISPGNEYNNRSVGVQINVPLYSGGYYLSTTRQALASKEKAEQQLEATRRSVSLQVQKEYKNVTSGLTRVNALEQAVRSNEQSVYSNTRSLAAGIRSRLNVLDAEQKLAQAQRDLADARFSYLLAKVKLYSLVGAADESVIAQLNALFQ